MIKNLEPNESVTLLQRNYTGHLAFIADSEIFTLPITYYYDDEENSMIGYSRPGQNINAMKKHPTVSIQVEEINSTNNWTSVSVHGPFEEIIGTEAKFLLHKFAQGIKRIINHKENRTLQSISEFSSDIFLGEVPIVYRIKIAEMTGKKMD